ncbi:MAG: [FeFe] hydrogenase H-cluster radical SAM maturase HydG [Spirochaetes bacterium]|nr:[FeFe] hydrogenase H-cluster radical SAM maturase HydG [Spirochaetota bacterium]
MSARTKRDGAPGAWLDGAAIQALLDTPTDGGRLPEILDRAMDLKGLPPSEVHVLMNLEEPAALEALFHAAKVVKERIYGPRIVLFAPLYLSNHCANECTYCAFRAGHNLTRRHLDRADLEAEVRALVAQGHKRVLLVAGEDASTAGVERIAEAVGTIYSVKEGRGEIRRVNVNIAPLSVEQFKVLKAADIGTYQLFQETYHRPTYAGAHLRGPKRDFDWRLSVMDRAMEAGIDDVGIGPLLGLYDWKFEILAMMGHLAHLEKRFGVGPHTISIPRLEPAAGSEIAARPPHLVSDRDFLKLIAILRLAVPYTGIILSTRESAALRREAMSLGVSQVSAGSRTDIGGYAHSSGEHPGQFQLGDHRSLGEVVRDLAAAGYVPSFCTACYRMGRTGADFMDLAKPGAIKHHCDPNALSSLREYLVDYATEETRGAGEALIQERLARMDERPATVAKRLLNGVDAGKRDVFV